MIKYVGKFRVVAPLDMKSDIPKITSNKNDTYLLGKYHTQVYRWDENILCIYFPSGVSSTNIVIPQFNQEGIEYELYIDGDYESIYKVKETDLDKIHSILHFQIKGKSISPFSVRTGRKQIKKKVSK